MLIVFRKESGLDAEEKDRELVVKGWSRKRIREDKINFWFHKNDVVMNSIKE